MGINPSNATTIPPHPSNHTYPPTNPPPYSDAPQGYGQQPVYPPQVTVLYPPNVNVVNEATVIPAVVVSPQMGRDSSQIVCRSCNQRILTRVERRPTSGTHLFALLLCVLGLWPCVCLPYCMDSCASADHYCPNCNAYIGSYLG